MKSDKDISKAKQEIEKLRGKVTDHNLQKICNH
jgi:hypothetical protein